MYQPIAIVIQRCLKILFRFRGLESIQPGGVYQDNVIFPTTISTMCYDNSVSKKLYDKIKRLASKNAAKVVNGWYIGYSAYEQRNSFRFCPVNVHAPLEYDLKVE